MVKPYAHLSRDVLMRRLSEARTAAMTWRDELDTARIFGWTEAERRAALALDNLAAIERELVEALDSK